MSMEYFVENPMVVKADPEVKLELLMVEVNDPVVNMEEVVGRVPLKLEIIIKYLSFSNRPGMSIVFCDFFVFTKYRVAKCSWQIFSRFLK